MEEIQYDAHEYLDENNNDKLDSADIKPCVIDGVWYWYDMVW